MLKLGREEATVGQAPVGTNTFLDVLLRGLFRKSKNILFTKCDCPSEHPAASTRPTLWPTALDTGWQPGTIARFKKLNHPATGNTFEFQLYTLPSTCHATGVMWKKTLILLPALLLLAGCASTATNISAQRQLRNADNLYPVEVTFDSRQQALRWDTIQVSVIAGKESYPLRPTKLMTNRWEGLVPVPAGVNTLNYHYKFDYQVTDFGKLSKGSAASQSYKLMILDK